MNQFKLFQIKCSLKIMNASIKISHFVKLTFKYVYTRLRNECINGFQIYRILIKVLNLFTYYKGFNEIESV